MEQVRRWDAGSVGEVERTDQGYLRCPATITRTGVFAYQQPGGKVRRELRLPAEVFDAAAMRSFGLAPLTNGHPPVMLSARNTARYQVGSVVEPRQDGDHVAAYVQITDADAIAEAEAGRRQLSCGYTCDLETCAGVTDGSDGVPAGLHYDAIQRNIRGNHVALVDKARAGSTVQLRLDGADAFQIESDELRFDRDPTTIQTLIFDKTKYSASEAAAWAKDHGFAVASNPGVDETEDSVRIRQRSPSQFETGSFRTIDLAPGIKAVIGRPKKTDGASNNGPLGDQSMESKIRIDGVSFECTPQVAEAVGKLMKRLDDAETDIEDFKKYHEQEKARADAAEESLAAEKKARADATSPEKIREAINARLALERAAAPILGDEVKFDGMTDADIKAAVVVACAQDKDLAKQRLDGCEDAYLQARYDAAIEAHANSEERNDALGEARRAGNNANRADAASDARQRMIERNYKLGRDPLSH